jgi:ribosomal protein S12 methylthiotransferase
MYSAVEGAAANALGGAVPEELKRERWDIFMQTQADISRARLRRKIGTVQAVLVDKVEAGTAIGRSMADAPEIDGIVTVRGAPALSPGDLVDVRIESADDYDLAGSLSR